MHLATDQVQHQRERGVALAWLSLSVRKTRSREERESFMRERHTPWFGSCSLINTLYVWFPASWAPMVAERLFGMSSHPGELSNNPQHGQPAFGLSQKSSRGHPWHQPGQEVAGPSGTMTEEQSSDVLQNPAMVIARCNSHAGAEC